MRFLLLSLCCCLAPALVAQAAQTSPPPAPLGVEDAVRLAVANNPRLSAAVRDVGAARQGVRSARAFTNPQVVFAPAVTAGGSDEEVLVSQPLELNGTRAARTGMAGAQLRRTEAQALAQLRNLVFDTKSAYYELARAQAQRALANDLLDAAEEVDRITRRQVELGTRPGVDQTRTGIEVIRARQQVTLTGSQVTATQAALNTLMGRPLTEPVGPLPPLPLPASGAPPAEGDALVRQALAARAEIMAEEAAAEGFRQEARLARAEGRPDLVPQLRSESVTRSGGEGVGIGVGISLPLFDFGSRRARVRQAEEAARAQADRAEVARRQVRQEVEQALARLRAAETVARDYQAGVLEQARRLLEASRVGFQAGQTSIVALLEAQRTFRSVESEYNDALTDAAEARAELERATGAVPAGLLPVAVAAATQETKTTR